MSIADIVAMAIKNLFKHKVRTFLTVLGVLIGTTSIISMMSLGLGIAKTQADSIASMGDLTVIRIYKPWNGGGSDDKSKPKMDDAAWETFKKYDGLSGVTPMLSVSLKSVSGKFQQYLNFYGVDMSQMEAVGYAPKEGRLPNGDDKNGVLCGYDVAFNYYNPSDRNWWNNREWWSPWSGTPDTRTPVIDIFNDKIQVSVDDSFGDKNPIRNSSKNPPKPITIIPTGLLDYSYTGDNNSVYIDLDLAIKLSNDKQKWNNATWTPSGGTGAKRRQNSGGYDQFLLKFKDMKYVIPALADLKSQGYDANSMAESMQELQKQSQMIQIILGALGSVSLFVAAIGISNTMIMSVYERTREIGIMKVIGASISDIKRLFLLEAAMIGVFGGCFGLGLSFLAAALVNKYGASQMLNVIGSYGPRSQEVKIAIMPIWLCVFAVGFAAAVGLISGYFPARRAMKLSALTAIKTE
ncbi:MAG: ABC transporter permease [Clostridiales bacterium]|jgi:ABC-type antimicrobial peptide transport system permease subunit|nr:ABC transporter permease [Clostridiales bacterium]